MKPFISGFTFVRNGMLFDYPCIESIQSLLPIVDEMIVNVGIGVDDTLEKVQELAAQNSKIILFQSKWDDSKREGGAVLAEQTDLAMAKCQGKWGIYLQADEVLHEQDYTKIQSAIAKADAASNIDGLLFDYVHFYGDFFIVNKNPTVYRREIRVVRLDRNVFSYRDAQGFRKNTNQGNKIQEKKLRVIASGAKIYHYGWVRPPQIMQKKTQAMDRLYHEDEDATGDNSVYKHIYGLERFTGTHPQLMQKRIQSKDWSIDLLKQPLVFKVADIRKVFSRWIERFTGWRPFEYKNYKRVRAKS